MLLIVAPNTRPTGHRAPRLLIAWLLAGLTAVTAAQVAAIERLTLSLGTVAHAGWTAEGVRLGYDLGTAKQPGPATLRIERLLLPGDWGAVADLRVQCPSLKLDGPVLRCEGAEVHGVLPRVGEQTFRADVSYRPATGTLDVELHGLQIAGGSVSVSARWSAEGWRLETTGRGLSVAKLVPMLPTPPPEGWSASGTLSVNATVTGRADTVETAVGELSGTGLAFSDAAGLHAGENLGGRLSWALDLRRQGWLGQAEVTLRAGQIYLDPVFTDFSAHPLTAEADLALPEGGGEIRLTAFQIAQEGLLQAHGEIALGRSPLQLKTLHMNPIQLYFPDAYSIYLKPFLIGTAVSDLETAGTLTGRIQLDGGELRRLELRLNDIHAADNGGRFAIREANGILHWAAGDAPPPPVSRLRWRGGQLYGIALGASRLQARLHGNDFRLTEPARLPLLDGALVVRRLAVRDAGSQQVTAELDAELQPISMRRLTEALGWPVFAGSLSGELPTLSYRDGTLTLGGELRARAFGGRISVQDLTLREPFGTLPVLSADIRLRALELKTLTEAFSFGRITGHLNGDIEGLRLIGWKPAAFRAWFRTPEDDPAPHRISQQAIQALSELGGAGAGAVLSQGLLRLFQDFSYARLGIGCLLKGNVCIMRGIEPAENGYYIVKGSGLPRIDVIGHVRRVSWPTLVAQIKSVTAAGQPVVE